MSAQELKTADNKYIQGKSYMAGMKLSQIWDDGRAVLRARWYLRHANQIGERVRVWGKPSIRNDGSLVIGSRVRLVSTIATLELVADGGMLEISDRTFINYGCSIAATELVRIGASCTIGTHVIIMDNDYHRLEPERRNERPDSAPIILEDNVWLGARVIILKGVKIGYVSVIGAGSVVNKNIPPRSLAAGMPAKIIRSL
jgi:acetyltransferase-like isoleucine patch superfamily enzyme